MRIFLAVFALLAAQQVSSQSVKQRHFYTAHVFLRAGEQHYTKWIHADSSGVTLQSLSDTTQIFHLRAEDILRIDIRSSNASTRNALYGAIIGFTIGFGTGWASYSDGHDGDINQIGRAAGTGLLGAFGGAFLGFVSGSFPKTYRILGQPQQYNRQLPKLARYNTLKRSFTF
jgi:hypothetical protein